MQHTKPGASRTPVWWIRSSISMAACSTSAPSCRAQETTGSMSSLLMTRQMARPHLRLGAHLPPREPSADSDNTKGRGAGAPTPTVTHAQTNGHPRTMRGAPLRSSPCLSSLSPLLHPPVGQLEPEPQSCLKGSGMGQERWRQRQQLEQRRRRPFRYVHGLSYKLSSNRKHNPTRGALSPCTQGTTAGQEWHQAEPSRHSHRQFALLLSLV